jgi:hypothetical protein
MANEQSQPIGQQLPQQQGGAAGAAQAGQVHAGGPAGQDQVPPPAAMGGAEDMEVEGGDGAQEDGAPAGGDVPGPPAGHQPGQWDDGDFVEFYQVPYKGVMLQVPPGVDHENQLILEALYTAYQVGAKGAARTARVRAEAQNEVRGGVKRSLKGSAKIGEPTKFEGRKGDGAKAIARAATECEAFLLEVRDYMRLTEVHESVWAQVAATYLGGHAKTIYAAHATSRERADGTVDWDFFQDTLRKAFVPRAQVAEEMHSFFSARFMEEKLAGMRSGKALVVDELVAATEMALSRVTQHNLGEVSELVKCQIFLAALPPCCRAILRLNEANEVHAVWRHLEAQMRKREEELRRAWERDCAEVQAAKKARSDTQAMPPTPAKKFEFGKGSIGGGSSSGARQGGASGSASGAGPSRDRDRKRPQPDDVCNACGRKGHWAKECPNKKNKK